MWPFASFSCIVMFSWWLCVLWHSSSLAALDLILRVGVWVIKWDFRLKPEPSQLDFIHWWFIGSISEQMMLVENCTNLWWHWSLIRHISFQICFDSWFKGMLVMIAYLYVVNTSLTFWYRHRPLKLAILTCQINWFRRLEWETKRGYPIRTDLKGTPFSSLSPASPNPDALSSDAGIIEEKIEKWSV